MDRSRWARVKSLFLRSRGADVSNLSNLLDGAGSTVAEVRRMIAVAGGGTRKLILDDTVLAGDDALVDQDPAFPPGALIANRFKIIALLGRGGMGQVYEALDIVKRDLVALKALHPSASISGAAGERLLRKEVSLAQRVSHRNICRTYDPYIHDDGGTRRVVVSMELLRGETLADVMAKGGKLPLAQVLDIGKQITAGLGAAHAAGVVHRDLKPSNVMLLEEPEGPRVVITDFGLASADDDLSSAATTFKGFAGTLRYMAPEQIEGSADHRSDLYQVCLIMYELATGGFPFNGSTGIAVGLNRLSISPQDPVRFLPTLPINWRLAMMRGLSRQPEKRFQNTQELIQAFETPAAPLSAIRLRFGFPHLRKLLVAAACCALLMVALYMWTRTPQEPTFAGSAHLLFAGLEHEASTDPVILAAGSSLLSSINQSPRLSAMSVSEVQNTFRRMGKGDNQTVTAQDMREAAYRTGSGMILTGSISHTGKYRLHLKLEAVTSNPRYEGQTITKDFEAETPKDMFRTVDAAALWVRHLSGEGTRDLFEQDARPEDLTTNSWDALHLIEEAESRRLANDAESALTFAEEALAIDPAFAAAESLRGDILSQRRQYKEGVAAHRRAIAMAKRRNITGRERFQIESVFNADTGDFDNLIRIDHEWIAHFPKDYLPHFNLSNVYFHRGNFQQALQEMEAARKLNPATYVIYPHLAADYLALSRPDLALECARQLRSLGEEQWAREVEGLTFAEQGRFDEALAKFRSIATPSVEKDDFWTGFRGLLVAHALAATGRLKEAEESLRAGATECDSRGDSAGKAERLLGAAYLRWLGNDLAGARLTLDSIMSNFDNPDSLSEAGALLARSGDLAGAQHAVALLSQWPDIPSARLARIRLNSEIALVRKDNRARSMVTLVDAREQSPLNLDFFLNSSRVLHSVSDETRLRRKIVQHPSALINDGEWSGVPGLFWSASRPGV